MSKDIEIKRNYAVYWRMFFLAIFGMVVSVFYYITQIVESSLLWMISTSIIAFVFLAIFISALRVLLNRTPAISITAEGINDSVSLAKGAEMIPWKEVKSVKYETYLNNDHILIALHHPELVLSKLSAIRKKMVNQQYEDTGAVIVINPKLIKAKPKELVEKIRKRARIK